MKTGSPRRIRVRTLMIAVAVAGMAFAALSRAIEAYESYRFRRYWNLCIVAGQITRVDHEHERIGISLGSDDGIVAGEELYLFRDEHRARYVGKARIISFDVQSAEARITRTVPGFAIRKGDGVFPVRFRKPLLLCGAMRWRLSPARKGQPAHQAAK